MKKTGWQFHPAHVKTSKFKSWTRLKPLQWISSGSIHLFFVCLSCAAGVCIKYIYAEEWIERAADIGVGARLRAAGRVYRPIHALARRSLGPQNDRGIGRGTTADAGCQVPLGSRGEFLHRAAFLPFRCAPDELGAAQKLRWASMRLFWRLLSALSLERWGQGRVLIILISEPRI